MPQRTIFLCHQCNVYHYWEFTNVEGRIACCLFQDLEVFTFFWWIVCKWPTTFIIRTARDRKDIRKICITWHFQSLFCVSLFPCKNLILGYLKTDYEPSIRSCTFDTKQEACCTVPKIRFLHSQKWSFLISFRIPTFMYLWGINKFPGSVCLFEKIRNGPNGIIRGLGETDSWKKPEAKNLVTLSL